MEISRASDAWNCTSGFYAQIANAVAVVVRGVVVLCVYNGISRHERRESWQFRALALAMRLLCNCSLQYVNKSFSKDLRR